MTEHTKEPWQAEPETGRGAWIKGATGEWSALSCGDNDESGKANARRICAAINATAGIPTEALEAGVVAWMRSLVECLLNNDPDDTIADGGVTVLDQWRLEASALLSRLGPTRESTNAD